MNANHFKKLFWVIFGLGIISLPLMTAATPALPTITIDVKSPTGINYNEVDQFTQSADKNSVKYAAQDGNQLFFSDKQINPSWNADNSRREYKPRHLADLGMKINTSDGVASFSLEKMPTYTLVSNDIELVPSVPDMPHLMVMSSASETKAVAPFAQALSTISSTAHEVLSVDNLWKILATGAIVLGGLLVVFGLRRTTHTDKTSVYSGTTTENEMVGKGKYFDFNGKLVNGKVTPINSTYLDMLWRVGKFSKDGSMSTYFYMVYYIPPQLDYAKSLKKEVKIKEETYE